MANVENAYEVEKLPGKAKVTICTIERVAIPGSEGKTRPQIVKKEIEQDAGYMVYCARGHSFRVKNEKELHELELVGPAPIVDLDTGDIVAAPRLSLKSRSKQ